MPNELEKVAQDKTTLSNFLQSKNALKTLGELETSHLTTKSIAALACLAASKNADIFKCTLTSVATAISEAVQLGLAFAGAQAQGHLVPRRNGKLSDASGHEVWELAFQIGYLGAVELARRSNQLEDIEARIVYENEKFSLTYTPAPELAHTPIIKGPTGKIIGAYAIAWMKGTSRPKVLWMREEELLKRKAVAKQTYIWDAWPGPMRQKTVLKAICKTLPLTPEASMAFALDDEADFGRNRPEEVDAQEGVSRTDQLTAMLKEKNGAGATSNDHVIDAEEVPPNPPPDMTDAEREYLEAEKGVAS